MPLEFTGLVIAGRRLCRPAITKVIPNTVTMVPGREVVGIVRMFKQSAPKWQQHGCCVAGLKVSEIERLASYDGPSDQGVNVYSRLSMVTMKEDYSQYLYLYLYYVLNIIEGHSFSSCNIMRQTVKKVHLYYR